jgi:hypothetical protein
MNGDFLAVAAFYALGAAVLAVVPLVPLALMSRGINSVQDARLPLTPTIELLALAAGILAGAIVLAANLHSETLTAAAIFRKGGYWDLPPHIFLAFRADPRIYDWSALTPWPLGGRPAGLSLIVAIIGAAVVYGPLVVFRTARAAANGARNAVILVWAAGTTIYLFNYALWVANELNFWIFLVLLVLLQLTRKKSEKPVVKIGG